MVHPDVLALRRFAQGCLEAAEAIKVANHLLDGCGACSTVLTQERNSEVQDKRALVSRATLDWVANAVLQPADRRGMLLKNTRVPCPQHVAEALEKLASGTSHYDLAAPPTFLLDLAIDTLLGTGLNETSQPQEAKQPVDPRASSALVRIGSKLAQVHLKSGEIEQATHALRRVTKAVINTNDTSLTGSTRAALLVTTATVLKARERDPASNPTESTPCDGVAGLLTTSRYHALVEAQQLYALTSDQYHHSQCALRLAEMVLYDGSDPRNEAGDPEAVEIDDLIENLSLHADRLAANGSHDLALIALRYLMTAYQTVERWAHALRACDLAVEEYGRLGQQEERLALVLEGARILRMAGETSRATQRYRAARRGLVLAGKPLQAAIAAVEAVEMQVELRREGKGHEDQRANDQPRNLAQSDIAAELSVIFVSGELDRPQIASLLLLRESYLDDSVTLEQVQGCLSQLSRSVP